MLRCHGRKRAFTREREPACAANSPRAVRDDGARVRRTGDCRDHTIHAICVPRRWNLSPTTCGMVTSCKCAPATRGSRLGGRARPRFQGGTLGTTLSRPALRPARRSRRRRATGSKSCSAIDIPIRRAASSKSSSRSFRSSLLWAAAWAALSVSYWLTLLISVPAAFFLVRLFLIQHDCGHGALFASG